LSFLLTPAGIALLGLFGAVGFAVDAALVQAGVTYDLDFAVFQIAADLRPGPIGVSATMFTLLGTGPGLLAMALVALLAMRARGEWMWTGLPLFSMLLGWVANPALKCAFLRERPSVDYIVPIFTECDIFAFPSGHAMLSMCLFGVLALWALSTSFRRRRMVAAALLSMALFIGLSRVILGVHWLSDVVGGWLAGLVVVSVVVLLGRWVARVRARI
jgi:undecaprenyl-diphosphatase